MVQIWRHAVHQANMVSDNSLARVPITATPVHYRQTNDKGQQDFPALVQVREIALNSKA